MGEGHSDRARAGAHVDDAHFFLSREALQHSFHQVFGFRPGYENSRRDLEAQAKKLLLAGQILHWFRGQAACDQAVKLLQFRDGQKTLGMGQQVGLIATKHVL